MPDDTKDQRELTIQQVEIAAAEVDKLLRARFEGTNVRFFCAIIPMVDGNRFPGQGEGEACFSANIIKAQTPDFLWKCLQIIAHAKLGDISTSFKPTGKPN